MGTVYRRQVRVCTTCDRRLDTTAAWRACEAADHAIAIRAQSIWWIKYQVGGRPQCVSSGSQKKKVAEDLLKAREGDVANGCPITAAVGQIRFEEAAADLVTDYRTNQKRSPTRPAASSTGTTSSANASSTKPANNSAPTCNSSASNDSPPLLVPA